jgi:hypothetical protein
MVEPRPGFAVARPGVARVVCGRIPGPARPGGRDRSILFRSRYGFRFTPPYLTGFVQLHDIIFSFGEVPEWLNGTVSKTVMAFLAIVGSNPTLSARLALLPSLKVSPLL